MLTSQRNSRRGFTAVELVLVIVVLAIVVGVTMWQVDKRRQAQLREESYQNLRQLYRGYPGTPKGVGWENSGVFRTGMSGAWPALSSIPGQLSLPPSDGILLHGDPPGISVASLIISPAHPQAYRMRKDALANHESAFTDDSYWYLGYVLRNEEAGLAFVEAYRKSIQKTGKPPAGKIKIESRIESNGDDYTLNLLSIFSRRPSIGHGYTVMQPIIRTPTPVLIERPGLQRGGSNVVWSNGKVEFIPYPGKFPMTEKFVKALESLDKLKVKP